MILVIRRILAVLAACGLVAAVFAYLGSYVGTTMDSRDRWEILLTIGIFILVLPMYAVDWELMKRRFSFWKAFSQGMPRWVIPTITLLGVFAAIHFFLFLIQSQAASPQIKNGKYVLDSHGKIVKELTEREYLRLKGAELRMFATGWMFLYLVPATYWWFPRERVSAELSLGTRTT